MDRETGLYGVLVCAAALLACAGGLAPPQSATFDDRGYVNETYGYHVLAHPRQDAKDPNALLGSDWRVDNLYTKGKETKQKESDDYLTWFSFDHDGDGTADSKERGFLYDLRFKHRQRDALVFIRTLPIGGDLVEKDLRVLAQRYVDAIAGAGYEAVELAGRVSVSEQRFAAEVVERGRARLGGQDAYSLTMNVANVDQLKLTPNARGTRVRIVLARTPFIHKVKPSPGVVKRPEYPVLLIAGYANLPEDFQIDQPAFENLLGRVEIGSKAGFEMLAPPTTDSPTESPAPPASAAAAPPAPSASPPTEAAPPQPEPATAPAPSSTP